ncbi:MAG: 6-phosphogluconolactonase [Egibacteraceae bacterium]
MDVEVAGNLPALAARGAALVAEVVGRAIQARGVAAVAFSGGSTPAPLFAQLARHDLPWGRVHVFQVDERVAPDGHPDRNLAVLRANLLDHVPADAHPMPVTAADLHGAARDYAALLRAVCGGVLDLVHLGLGDDGHTASWPPGDPVVDAPGDVAVVGTYRGRVRMTLTPVMVNRARRILWLVDGADKASVLARLLSGDDALPAARVRRRDSLVLADEAAVR